jgi:hypothetical protein
MITSSLIFHISSQWKQNNTSSSLNQQQKLIRNRNQRSNKIKDLFPNSDLPKKNNRRHITIDLDTYENIKTAKDLNQILKDIQTYRNQLHETHGSIRIRTYSSPSRRCCCDRNQSNEIARQISDFENELIQSDFVEYIYKIECIENKNPILK